VADTHASWVERDAAVVWHGFTQMSCYPDNAPVVVERAEGREVIDVDGRHYLDAISSLWVITLGHRVPELDEALRSQIDRVAHSTLLGNGNRATIELAEALAEVVPVDAPHTLFASDGAAAVEQGLKIAFQYWTNQGITGRDRYLAFDGAYHGDTIGSLSVGDGGFGTTVFDPLRFPVVRAPIDDAAASVALIDAHAHELAAVVIEPLVQGAAGMRLNEPSFVRAVAAACARNDVLLICDEVATGFGRTGTMFACEQESVTPDLLCLAKGISGGYLPLAATLATDRVYAGFLGDYERKLTFFHGHTYTGNPLACAAGLASLDLFARDHVIERLQPKIARLHARLDAALAPLAPVVEIRRRGFMVGVELGPYAYEQQMGARVCLDLRKRGVLLRPLGSVVVMMPPLSIGDDEIDRLVDATRASIVEVCDAAK
jgi:adenosylmethionine---8-amino-7-oxononanoate aminotransferase